MTGLLDDHRRFGAAGLVVLVGLALALTAALTGAGRGSEIAGLWAGVAVAATDAVLLMRGVTRFGRLAGGAITAKGLTGALLSRFAAVAVLLGLTMAARALDPIAVLSGFLLLPLSLIIAGCVAVRTSAGRGVTGRRRLAR